MAKRVLLDCREYPNEIGCTLMIIGSVKEVLKVSLKHSVEDHGHKDTKELRKQLKAMLKPVNKQKAVIK